MLRRVHTGFIHKPLRIALGAALVAAGGALIVVRATSDDGGDGGSLADASRVLQSVNVQIDPDGALTAIKSTATGITTTDEQFTSKASHTPGSAASELPVRVLTSYRTKDKSGTDLSDLDGYTGPLDISITVQNLTVKPRTLTYDVGGVERSRSALVGAPLTVVGSTQLEGAKPASVHTVAGKDGAATNGVLSQDATGTPQVQWATILAPPQLGSSTAMRLVMDAKNFKVPAFDISVQPGLVTDPSVGALVDSAFNPSESSQMRLEQRTISLIGQVTTVLARAGSSMDRVRSTLGESSRTLGTKTVRDLTSSTATIASSVKGLKGSVAGLGSDLNTSLSSTKSTTLTELQTMVTAVDQLLGDTSAKPPAATITGSGCEVTASAPKGADSVYGNLMRVVSLLNGYANASSSCKSTVQRAILDSVGPKQPSADSCTPASTSVTCAIFNVGGGIKNVALELRADGDAAIADLGSLGVAQALAATENLKARAGDLDLAAAALADAFGQDGGGDVSGVTDALHQAESAAHDLGSAVGTLHGAALSGLRDASRLGDLNGDLGAKICDLADSGGLSPADALTLRSYVAHTSCPDADGATVPLPGAPGGRDSMDEQISSQEQAWTDLASSTDQAETGQGLGLALSNLNARLDEIDQAIRDLQTASNSESGTLRTLFDDLQSKKVALTRAQGDVERAVDAVDHQQSGVVDAVRAAFDDAAANTSDQVGNTLDPEIRRVSANAELNNAALGRLFDKSLSGLTGAAGTIAIDGAKTVTRGKGEFDARQKISSQRISASIAKGLAQVTKGVSGSTLDLQAAQQLLNRDLQNVLLDLGTRQVSGSGLLGAMATSAATTGSANYQLGLASDAASSYASVRKGDISGLLLRQAQADEAQRMQAELPAFRLKLPSSAEHRTVYTFHLTSGS